LGSPAFSSGIVTWNVPAPTGLFQNDFGAEVFQACELRATDAGISGTHNCKKAWPKWWGAEFSPPLRGGVAARSRNGREASLARAAGVVINFNNNSVGVGSPPRPLHKGGFAKFY